MNSIKLLIDTNVVIGLEDAKEVGPAFAELSRKCGEQHIDLFVHEASYQDVSRDPDTQRRAVTLSKLQKFQQLRGIRLPPRDALVSQFGAINSPNDETDVALLVALQSRAIDFLVTEDVGIHRRADRASLADRVFTVVGALAWIRQTFEPAEVRLPYIDEKFAYELDGADEIFDSLRAGYANFDEWWLEKCVRKHRRCWTVTADGELAGIVLRKENEPHEEAQTVHSGPKILKICTFKVKPKFRGGKLGEQLLKQTLWYAQRNRYDLTYLTAYPEQSFLIRLLQLYGFKHTKTLSNGELLLEKALLNSRMTLGPSDNRLDAHRQWYPRFSDDSETQKFCIPIQGDFHRKLFPEIAFATPLPLFPSDDFKPMLPTGSDARIPGNTIRKVYVCRAPTTAINAGDILLFYMSKSESLIGSQSITSVGIAERVSITDNLDELTRLTAKRSVFSAVELEAILAARDSPVKVIDFHLAGHLEPPIDLATLRADGVFPGGPPQSITKLSNERYERLKERVNLGFQL